MDIALIHLKIYLRSEITFRKHIWERKLLFRKVAEEKKNLYAEIQARTQFSGANLSPGI